MRLALAAALTLLAGCRPPIDAGEPPPPQAALPREVPAPAAPAPTGSAPPAEAASPGGALPRATRAIPGVPLPLAVADTGSTVALVSAGGHVLAYVADQDDAVLRTVDLDDRVELAATPTGGSPAALLVLADGRVAVAIEDRARVALFEPTGDAGQPLRPGPTAAVAAEPVGLAATPGDALLLVVSRWGHALTALDGGTLAPRAAIDLPRDPRGVIAAADGRRAFVAHAAGAGVTVVDLDGKRPPRLVDLRGREVLEVTSMPVNVTPGGWEMMRDWPNRTTTSARIHHPVQGAALVRTPEGHILATGAMVDPGAARDAPEGYGVWHGTVEDVAVLRESDEKRIDPPLAHRFRAPSCILPRAAALDAAHGQLLVACAGMDAVVSFDLAARHERTRLWRDQPWVWPVPGGVSGLAVDVARGRAVVWSQAGHGLSILSLATPRDDPGGRDDGRRGAARESRWLALARTTPRDPLVEKGRALFHATESRAVSMDGRACAGCHPDGRDDGLTWATPEGPRQTPMLLGRLEGTAPYGWDGSRADLGSHLDRTITRLRGTGLDAEQKRALFAYLGSLTPPGGGAAEPSPAVARGSVVFHSTQAGCSGCHLGDDVLTDGARHNLGSRVRGDKTGAFDTPSLRFVSRSAPYFHDGRYATLASMLRGAGDTMGHTSQLSRADRAALVEYLGSL